MAVARKALRVRAGAQAPKPRRHSARRHVAAPTREADAASAPSFDPLGPTVSRETIRSLERELDGGASVAALREFNDALAALPAPGLHARMRPVWNELAHNLETFNPVFTAVMLKLQLTVGLSDYERRDAALQHLIQPLGGEYGLGASKPLAPTHRQLYSQFYESVTGEALQALLAEGEAPEASEHLFACMMRDVSTGGGKACPMEQASYALGYNLAVEYLAAYEKQWLLDSFRALDSSVLQGEGKAVEWEFLEIHALGEPEHADLGHQAVAAVVPDTHEETLRAAMLDHDRDFAEFYSQLTRLLRQ